MTSPRMVDRVAFCRQKAAESAEHAKGLPPGMLRDSYLALAKQWLDLAENIERTKSGRDRQRRLSNEGLTVKSFASSLLLPMTDGGSEAANKNSGSPERSPAQIFPSRNLRI